MASALLSALVERCFVSRPSDLAGQKKSHNLTGQKNIMQPLGPKNQRNQGKRALLTHQGTLNSSGHSKLIRALKTHKGTLNSSGHSKLIRTL